MGERSAKAIKTWHSYLPTSTIATKPPIFFFFLVPTLEFCLERHFSLHRCFFSTLEFVAAMGSTEDEANTSKPISLYDSTLPTEPLLSKPTTSSNYLSHPIEEPAQPDPSEPDPTQFLQISFNYGPRPFKDLPFLILFLLLVICTFGFAIIGIIIWIIVANWHRIELTIRIIGVASDALSKNLGLFLVIPSLTVGLVIYYAPIVVFLVFSRYNGKIVAKESNGEYTCVWKQDSWVPAYFTLAILTMLWSLTTMVEAQVYVISGTIAQWYFCKDDSKPKRSIRSSLRNAFGPSSGTVCLSGLLICAVRVVRAAVDSARHEEDVPGMVQLVLRCCVNTLLSAIEFLNKFTINFAAITGEAYCTSARMTYELLRRNLLSAVFVETISTRLLAGVIFVLSAIYAIIVWAILRGASNLGDAAYIVAALAWLLLIVVLAFFVHVLDNVIDTVYVCYAIDRDRGEVYKQEVHEATMICVDNSEWMRNGDYTPSRFQAQADAVSLICGAKTQSNPENTVGILTMAGKGVRVLATPTSDLGKILSCMHGLEMGGEMNLAAGIQIAQLALKHRQNKNQQQRIIVFAGSPIKYEKKTLEMIGKKLKKNSVALDIVDFGEDEDGKPEKLEALLAAVNNNDTSHIVHVPAGQNALSDVLISTPVFTGDGEGGSGFAAAAAAAAAAGSSDFDFGVDPNIDPELALALRVSMEEERARQEAAAKRAAEEASKQEKGEEAQPQSDSQNATTTTTEKAADPMDEDDALLKQALALSMNIPGSDSSAADAEMSEATNDDQELALALQMSMQESSKDSSGQTDVSKVLGDQSFMSSILSSLPGVDPNDPDVKDLLASLPGQSEPISNQVKSSVSLNAKQTLEEFVETVPVD
ncbi:von Willebrand factor, type A [Corchorus capsularis]|uniref:26S proteasome non-ATPase regulatory subunit 4 homolog n=1 Tax=Corchorus capsularis TaxID=210143 RepID=A0A1R3HVU9_COCAP|nr:von Willebrand factor, type A [Corchorus capsularis]